MKPLSSKGKKSCTFTLDVRNKSSWNVAWWRLSNLRRLINGALNQKTPDCHEHKIMKKLMRRWAFCRRNSETGFFDSSHSGSTWTVTLKRCDISKVKNLSSCTLWLLSLEAPLSWVSFQAGWFIGCDQVSKPHPDAVRLLPSS